MQRSLRRHFPDGGQRLTAVAQFPVRAVLHNEAVQFPGQPHHFPALLQRHRFARGVVEIRNHIDELHLALQGAGLRGPFPYVGPIGSETLQGAQVHRILGQDNISRIQENTGANVDALLGGGGYLHLRNRHPIALCQHFPQFGNALRGPVLEGTGAVLFQHTGRQAGDFGHGEGAGRRIASGKGADGVQVHFPENLPNRRAHERRNVRREKFSIVCHKSGLFHSLQRYGFFFTNT